MRVFRYRLPLTHVIQLGPRLLEHRDGLLLEENGRWSEAAPLLHFSQESLEDVLAALRSGQSVPPSLQFALDGLEQPLTPQNLPINALLQGSTSDILAKCRTLSASTCRAVKLKVGRRHLQEEVDLVREVCACLRDDQQLRLDANRAWDWRQAIAFASQVAELDIQYVEEPLQDHRQLEAFASETNLPYALDETLTHTRSLDSFPNARACVVKPTMLGGRKRIRSIAELGKPIVFSACYESGVGLTQIVQLANKFGSGTPAGLDTYHVLAEDVLTKRLLVKDWKIHVPATLEVNHDLLEEVVL